MKLGKRSLALILGTLLCLGSFLSLPAAFFAAEDPSLTAIYASDLQKLITNVKTGYDAYPATYDKDPSGGSIGIWNAGNPKTYDKGIAIHAPSDIDFNVKGLHVVKFSAWVGLEDDLRGNAYLTSADTTFFVKADGKVLENGTSSYITSNSEAYYIEVEIPEGTETVTLSNDTGSSTFSDHTVWADAKFYFSSVEGLTITKLALEKETYSLNVEDHTTVQKTNDEDPTIANFVYSVGDPSIASITESGVLTGLKPGKTTVTLTETYSGISASADVTVTKELNKTYRNYNDFVAYNTNDQHPIVYSAENPNEVKMKVFTGEVRKGGNPQMLLTSAPDEDFTATVKVSGGLSANFQSAGLVVYGGDGVCVAFERRYHSYFTGTNVFCHTTPTDISDAPLSETEYIEKYTQDTNHTQDAYLRITKVEDSFHCYYSYTGNENDWTEVDTAPLSSMLAGSEDLRVGIITRSGTVSAPVIEVTFSDFTLNDRVIPFSLQSTSHDLCQFYETEEQTFEQTGSPLSKLPKTVKGYVSDGTDKDIPVEWDVEVLESGKTGSFTLTGRPASDSDYANSGVTVEIQVTVTERTSFDLSGDGILNIKDISRLLICLEAPEAAPTGDPDVNFDGTTNIEDVSVLLQMLTGKNA